MNPFKSLVPAVAGLMFAASAIAQTAPVTSTNSFTVNQAIPMGSASGLANSQFLNFTSQQLYAVTDVQVTLNISGGYNGDYYAYLVHDGGFSVLLNRVGTTSSNPSGYSDSGFSITLSGSSANDIHNYQSIYNPNGGVVTGTWDVDGRIADPSVVLDTTPRTGMLDSFDGTDPSGQWTLFLVNTDYGEQGTLDSWGLTITAVPEPSTIGLLATGLGGFMVIARRRR